MLQCLDGVSRETEQQTAAIDDLLSRMTPFFLPFQLGAR
jgi:hypothetical protein